MKRVVERVDTLIPAQPRALRVCAYARVSTGKDAMLHSLSAQVSYYSKMIQSHSGWMYCGVYSDEAVTGTKRERAGLPPGEHRSCYYEEHIPFRQKYGNASSNCPRAEKPGYRCVL